MRRLNDADARALIELLGLALERRDPVALIDAARKTWRSGALSRAAARCADAMRDGRALSGALPGALPAASLAALLAGERSDDPSGGLARAAAALGRSARTRRFVLAPAAYPLSVLSVAGVAGAILTLFAAPSIQALRVEIAAFAGRPEPGGAVALAAAHPTLVAALGALLAVLPLLLPLAIAWIPRTRAGGALMLKLPFIGEAVRWRACADLLESLGDLIGGGVAHDEAWRLACAAVGPRLPRARLLALTPEAAAGEPLDELLLAGGLPERAALRVRPELLRRDGGVTVMRETAAAADAVHERILSLGGRAFAFTAGAAGVAAAAGLLAAVLVPLFQVGAIG